MNTQTFHGRKTLSGWLKKPLKKVQQKRGFAEGRLLTEWEHIVGPALAQHSAPQKLSFPKGQHGATLHLLCEAGWATELQYQQEMICEKIATFFGYRAVGVIRIHQGPVPKAPANTRSEAPTGELPEALNDELKQVEDEALQSALIRLGLSREGQRALANEDANAHKESEKHKEAL